MIAPKLKDEAAAFVALLTVVANADVHSLVRELGDTKPGQSCATVVRRRDLVKPIRLTIQGMASAGCAETVEHAIRTVPGVMSVRVDLAGSDVLVEAGETVEVNALLAAVQQAGYVATLAG